MMPRTDQLSTVFSCRFVLCSTRPWLWKPRSSRSVRRDWIWSSYNTGGSTARVRNMESSRIWFSETPSGFTCIVPGLDMTRIALWLILMS